MVVRSHARPESVLTTRQRGSVEPRTLAIARAGAPAWPMPVTVVAVPSRRTHQTDRPAATMSMTSGATVRRNRDPPTSMRLTKPPLVDGNGVPCVEAFATHTASDADASARGSAPTTTRRSTLPWLRPTKSARPRLSPRRAVTVTQAPRGVVTTAKGCVSSWSEKSCPARVAPGATPTVSGARTAATQTWTPIRGKRIRCPRVDGGRVAYRRVTAPAGTTAGRAPSAPAS